MPPINNIYPSKPSHALSSHPYLTLDSIPSGNGTLAKLQMIKTQTKVLCSSGRMGVCIVPISSHYLADRSSLSPPSCCGYVLRVRCIVRYQHSLEGNNNLNCHPIKLEVNMDCVKSLYKKCCEIELAPGDEHGEPGLIEGDIPSFPLTDGNL